MIKREGESMSDSIRSEMRKIATHINGNTVDRRQAKKAVWRLLKTTTYLKNDVCNLKSEIRNLRITLIISCIAFIGILIYVS